MVSLSVSSVEASAVDQQAVEFAGEVEEGTHTVPEMESSGWMYGRSNYTTTQLLATMHSISLVGGKPYI
jgi:hypothetical protein